MAILYPQVDNFSVSCSVSLQTLEEQSLLSLKKKKLENECFQARVHEHMQ